MPDTPAPTLGGTPNPSLPPLPPPPTGFGGQMAQLVVIPALIVIAAVGVALIFGALAGAPDSIENHLIRLRQSSGRGNVALGFQDPRYKDRCYAAANIAQMLPGITDPQKRTALNRELADILGSTVGEEEYELQAFILLAVGQLGEPDGLPLLLSYSESKSGMVRMAVPRALSSWAEAGRTTGEWPNQQNAYTAGMPVLVKLMEDKEPTVAAETARVIGVLSRPGDEAAIKALRQGLGRTGQASREVQWNAAIALARLGEEDGGRVVAQVLLDRETLRKLASSDRDSQTTRQMRDADQDHVILHTLAAVRGSPGEAEVMGALSMNSPQVWEKIRQLADSDPNMAIRNAASGLLKWKTSHQNGTPVEKNPSR